MISNYDYKHRLEIEKTVLGQILVLKDNHKATQELFLKHGFDQSDYFLDEEHQNVFSLIQCCWSENISADILTVGKFKHKFYKTNSKESSLFDVLVIGLTQSAFTTAFLEHNILILKQYVLFQYWNDRCEDIHQSNWNERDVFMVSDNIVQGYNELVNKFVKGISKTKSVRQKQREKYELIQKGQYFTIPTGLKEFDEITDGGFIPSEFTIIAGRPGMGKTSISLAIAMLSAYQYGKRGLFITIEMTKVQLQNRIIATLLGIEYHRIKAMSITQDEYEKVEKMYEWFENESNLVILDRNDACTITEIDNAIKEHKPEFVMVDYIQLITLDGKVKSKVGNREQEISEISRSLKAFSTEYDIPVIGLSQLSRSCESRPNKRPILSDLRESGSLEQDADNVYFYYRDAYYKKLAGQVVPPWEEGNFELIMAKGRESNLKIFHYHIDFKTSTLQDYSMTQQDYELPRKIMERPPIPDGLVTAPPLPPPPM